MPTPKVPVTWRFDSCTSGLITTAANGVATTTIAGVKGDIEGVFVDMGTSTSAAVTVTSDKSAVVLNGPTVTADTFYPVRRNALTNDGSTAITNSYIPYINFGGDMTVAVASGGDAKTLTVVIYFR